MKSSRDDQGRLVLTHRPVAAAFVCFGQIAVLVPYSIVAAVREGPGPDTLYWPLGVCVLLFCGGVYFARWWTIVFDPAACEVRWRDRGVLGSKTGRIGFGRITGVSVLTDRVGSTRSRRRPRRYLALSLADASGFRLTRHSSATPRGESALRATASLIRREIGLEETTGEAAAIDAALAAPSKVEAIRHLHQELGLDLASAKRIVEAAGSPGG